MFHSCEFNRALLLPFQGMETGCQTEIPEVEHEGICHPHNATLILPFPNTPRTQILAFYFHRCHRACELSRLKSNTFYLLGQSSSLGYVPPALSYSETHPNKSRFAHSYRLFTPAVRVPSKTLISLSPGGVCPRTDHPHGRKTTSSCTSPDSACRIQH